MAYLANSIGRTLMGELFVTDSLSQVHIQGSEQFQEHWVNFLTVKRDTIVSLVGLKSIDAIYNAIYPNADVLWYRSREYKKKSIMVFLETWIPRINEANITLSWIGSIHDVINTEQL